MNAYANTIQFNQNALGKRQDSGSTALRPEQNCFGISTWRDESYNMKSINEAPRSLHTEVSHL